MSQENFKETNRTTDELSFSDLLHHGVDGEVHCSSGFKIEGWVYCSLFGRPDAVSRHTC